MSLSEHIRKGLEKKKILLMTHVVVGYPSLEANWSMLQAMSEAEVDLVELQMPFSEPTADGPLFVRANQESLSRGTNLDDYFTLMKRVVGECPMQVLMMGYCNTAFMIGFDQFPEMLKENGASGFIIPDLPVEEYGVLHKKSADCEIHPVMLCTPTNTPARLEKILSNASGFVYCVSRKGVTGKSTELNKETSDFLEQCREMTDVPLALGFGLSRAKDLKMLHGKAEIAIVGSALLRSWEEGGESQYREHLFELASARN